MLAKRSKFDAVSALIIVLFGLVIGFGYHVHLWHLEADGFSPVSEKLPYWDFTNLWAGGVLASNGSVETIFDVESYRAFLRQMFTPRLADQEWSYPPSILLIGIPLSQLPIFPAYVLWTAGTIALLHFALRPLSLPPLAHLACLLSPAGFINAALGQNGALTAALLIGGLSLVFSRPVIAGILFGLLTMKPHLGLLIPICLLASGSYRAFLSATVTAVLLFLVTGLALGFDVWQVFMEKTAPMMSSILEAPYPQTYHSHAMTVFVMARWLGLDVAGAYVVQGVVLLGCAALVAYLWRPSSSIEHAKRVCITATLSIVASPYGYSYDTIPMCVTAAFLFVTDTRVNKWLLAFVWLYPLYVHRVNHEGIGIGVLVPILLVSSALLVGGRSAPRSEALA
ncbi:glycosyltransferase family 87 protein [Rhizobium sp. BK251]|uniref:glycosyltransferase family 87 protein n=1 Tax=Rhizobium sp. BK251 TaxID=2512125 RepID=UPI0010530B16|nr:glycosyltransferase family 87 protein [Rhizobium sp. BK251]TCL73118.1 uncharacterized protein DUF2029 [Rhizobium sp. BK251]